MPRVNPAGRRDVYVASFNDLHGWGGGVAAAKELASACERRGLGVLTLGVSGPGNGRPVSADGARHLHAALTPPAGLWRIQSWRVIRVLRGFLRRLPPPRAAFIGNNMFWVVAAKRTWPRVRVAYRFPCLLTNCLPFTWPNRRPPTLWDRVNLAAIRRAESLALRLADLTIVPTRHGWEEITAFCPAAEDRLSLCHFGCGQFTFDESIRRRQRRALGLDDDVFLVIAVGVCDWNKAFDLAIRALPGCDPRAALVIIGDGPERSGWERLAQTLGLGARVRFVGPQRDMGPWYAAADCVVSTSFYDAYPNVIREAMHCGRPVIVPDHRPPHVYAGIAETVQRAGAGLLYDRQRPGALVDALDRLMSGETAARCAVHARQSAQRIFRWDAFLDLILRPAGQAGPIPSQEPAAGPCTAS